MKSRRVSQNKNPPWGWLIQDLNRDGACGNAAGAEAQKGELLLNRGVEHFIAMLRELDGLSTDDLDAFPT